jgi:hypothetical protein
LAFVWVIGIWNLVLGILVNRESNHLLKLELPDPKTLASACRPFIKRFILDGTGRSKSLSSGELS